MYWEQRTIIFIMHLHIVKELACMVQWKQQPVPSTFYRSMEVWQGRNCHSNSANNDYVCNKPL